MTHIIYEGLFVQLIIKFFPLVDKKFIHSSSYFRDTEKLIFPKLYLGFKVFLE